MTLTDSFLIAPESRFCDSLLAVVSFGGREVVL